jgi:hypothetical protein
VLSNVASTSDGYVEMGAGARTWSGDSDYGAPAVRSKKFAKFALTNTSLPLPSLKLPLLK